MFFMDDLQEQLPKTPRQTPVYKRKGKRQRTAIEVMDELEICPFKAIIRISVKAEKAKQYNVAIRGWCELAGYLQPKFKAIDPLEQAEKANKLMGLAELGKLKDAILNGDVVAIEGGTVTEQEGDALL